ncbi:MAG: cytochrome d ubiquinol oxidase subunit II [Planctomycetota bacterium]
METVWFCLVSVLIALYVVLDGFDLGAGALHLLVAKTEEERRAVLRSIGPVWDGNEVWLLAAGGTLYFAFPAVYASSFSGFYLPLMLVLWLLIARGISVEFRNHLRGPVWTPFWDFVFCAASLLLAVFFGAALGNVVRGVPLDGTGRFFEPLWTDLRPNGRTGILDPYTILVGATALSALALHGALWIVLKTEGAVRGRARRAALVLRGVVPALTVVLTLATYSVQPHVAARLVEQPWGSVFPALAVAGILVVWRALARDAEGRAFLGSCAYLLGMMASAVFGLYPYLLPSSGDPELGLTVHNAAAGAYGLRAGLFWWIPGVLLAALYTAYVYRRFAGKVRLEGEGY